MKTSNYIATAYFIFIFGSTLTLYVLSKLHRQDGGYMPKKFSRVEKKLDKFSVIVAEKGARFHLVTDSVFKIEASLSENDSSYHFPVYKIENDTFYIQSSNYEHINPEIHCSSITSIIGKSKNRIDLDRFVADSLILDINKGNVYGSFSEKGIVNLKIKATNYSDVYLQGSKIENLKITLYQSKARVYNNDVKTIDAKLFNKSDLFGKAKNKVYLQTDSTSNYRVED